MLAPAVASRLEDWPERLAAYLLAHMAVPFAWGTNDCVTFANGEHEAVTGVRIALPQWADEAQAQAELGRRGGLEAAVGGVLPRVPLAMALRGDLVLMHEPAATPDLASHRWLAVIEDGYGWAPHRSGLKRLPLEGHALAAWGVGHG